MTSENDLKNEFNFRFYKKILYLLLIVIINFLVYSLYIGQIELYILIPFLFGFLILLIFIANQNELIDLELNENWLTIVYYNPIDKILKDKISMQNIISLNYKEKKNKLTIKTRINNKIIRLSIVEKSKIKNLKDIRDIANLKN